MKICLVTSSLVGPTTNGGVGTAFYYLATELAKAGHNVTILFNGAIQVQNSKYWEQKYAEMGISFKYLQDKYGKGNVTIDEMNWWKWRSYFVLQWFKDNDGEFDIIHFPEVCGYAYHVLQAKRTTSLFQNTKIVVTMHSSTEWINQGMEEWPYEIGERDRKNLLFLEVNYAERYSCQYCDYLLAPSQAILDWAIKKGWKLCEKREVLFNPYSSSIYKTTISNVNYHHFIFFGRLEKLKGLDVFCEAIVKLIDDKDEMEKANFEISFLGRESTIDGERAVNYIKRVLSQKGIKYNIHTKFNTFEAIEYMKETRGIAVLSSYLDNSPYSIVECIANSVPFICSNRGGIPELVDDRVIFEPSIDGLVRKLEKIDNINFGELQHKYNKRKANKKIVEFHENIGIQKHIVIDTNVNKRVSICIAYRNHGLFINDLIESLADNSYKNYEIIIGDAGSDDDASINVLNSIKDDFSDIPISIIHVNSKCKGKVLNECVKNAKGEICIFVDAESIVTRDFIQKYVYAIDKKQLDAVSSFAKQIKGVGQPTVLNTYNNLVKVPIGAALEVSILKKCLLNTSFAVRKDLIEVMGGFVEVDYSGTESNFMVRVILQEYKMDVVPEIIEYSRDVDVHINRRFPCEEGYKTHQLVLQPIYDNCESYIRHFITNWCVARYENEKQDTVPLKSTQNTPVKPEIKIVEKQKVVQDPQLLERIASLQKEIDTFQNATFWKITKPLQAIVDFLKKLRKA